MNLVNNGIHRVIYSDRGSRGVRDRGQKCWQRRGAG